MGAVLVANGKHPFAIPAHRTGSPDSGVRRNAPERPLNAPCGRSEVWGTVHVQSCWTASENQHDRKRYAQAEHSGPCERQPHARDPHEKREARRDADPFEDEAARPW